MIGRWLAIDAAGNEVANWSSYDYVLDGPVRLDDPDGAFSRAVHFNLTYFMAAKVMGSSAERARTIATGNQHVDDDFETAI